MDVGGDRNHQDVALLPCLGKVADMPRMQEVEHAVTLNDGLPLRLLFSQDRGEFGDRLDLLNRRTLVVERFYI